VELAYTSFDANAKIFKYDPLARGDYRGKIHPTQKPLPLFQWCLQNYSKEGDLILDCFSGSGTTAVACHNIHRRFICIEKDPEYHAASVERLKREQAQMRLF
jgi:DNA modification methylase